MMSASTGFSISGTQTSAPVAFATGATAPTWSKCVCVSRMPSSVRPSSSSAPRSFGASSPGSTIRALSEPSRRKMYVFSATGPTVNMRTSMTPEATWARLYTYGRPRSHPRSAQALAPAADLGPNAGFPPAWRNAPNPHRGLAGLVARQPSKPVGFPPHGRARKRVRERGRLHADRMHGGNRRAADRRARRADHGRRREPDDLCHAGARVGHQPGPLDARGGALGALHPALPHDRRVRRADAAWAGGLGRDHGGVA